MTLVRRNSIDDRDPLALARSFFGFDPFAVRTADRPAGFNVNFEVKETDEALVFTGDLPGVKKEDLDIALDGNVLTISGTRASEQKKEGETYFVYERQYGSFSRSFKLPDYADREAIEADLTNGVLEVTIPKQAASKPRKIALKS